MKFTMVPNSFIDPLKDWYNVGTTDVTNGLYRTSTRLNVFNTYLSFILLHLEIFLWKHVTLTLPGKVSVINKWQRMKKTP
jgi:hypothetical protein